MVSQSPEFRSGNGNVSPVWAKIVRPDMLILVTLVDPTRTNALLPEGFSMVFEQVIDNPEVV